VKSSAAKDKQMAMLVFVMELLTDN